MFICRTPPSDHLIIECVLNSQPTSAVDQRKFEQVSTIDKVCEIADGRSLSDSFRSIRMFEGRELKAAVASATNVTRI